MTQWAVSPSLASCRGSLQNYHDRVILAETQMCTHNKYTVTSVEGLAGIAIIKMEIHVYPLQDFIFYFFVVVVYCV